MPVRSSPISDTPLLRLLVYDADVPSSTTNRNIKVGFMSAICLSAAISGKYMLQVDSNVILRRPSIKRKRVTAHQRHGIRPSEIFKHTGKRVVFRVVDAC